VQDPMIIEQVQTFALTIALGMFIGIGYDCLRGLKTVIRFTRPAMFVTDLLFWIVMTAVVFVSLLSSNWGEVRAYVFIGLGTGGILYVLLASRPVYRLILCIYSAIAAVIRFFLRPVRWAAQKVSAIIARIKIISTKIQRKKKE
jgi:spore cortex biosynthesis protein YabQ